MGNSSEEIRLRYLYRNLILRGGIRMPVEVARRLVGPDCAFHLYTLEGARAGEPPAGDLGPREAPEA